jgi:hypothetical protein
VRSVVFSSKGAGQRPPAVVDSTQAKKAGPSSRTGNMGYGNGLRASLEPIGVRIQGDDAGGQSAERLTA